MYLECLGWGTGAVRLLHYALPVTVYLFPSVGLCVFKVLVGNNRLLHLSVHSSRDGEGFSGGFRYAEKGSPPAQKFLQVQPKWHSLKFSHAKSKQSLRVINDDGGYPCGVVSSVPGRSAEGLACGASRLQANRGLGKNHGTIHLAGTAEVQVHHAELYMILYCDTE
jgi:hypothetical protein